MDPKVVSNVNGMHRCPFPGCAFKDSSAAVNQHVTETHFLQMFSIMTELRAELQEEKKKRATLENTVEVLTEQLRREMVDLRLKSEKNTLRLGVIQSQQEEVESTMHNGVFIWKIKNFEEHYWAATHGNVTMLQSRPFHTSPHGYRMSICVYLRGDGAGQNTHISVFFMLMRSENDIHLRWPFTQPVTLTLVNRDPSRSISKTFRPDYTVSFMRPHSEENVPSGFPCFAPNSVLSDWGFVENDTMVITIKTNVVDQYL